MKTVAQGLRVTVVDPDDDYLGIEIQARNDRFAGSTRIYAGRNELGEFADRIAGFPSHPGDERAYEFGSLNPKVAGGYSSLRFRTIDGAGRSVLDVRLEDDGSQYAPAAATFSFHVEAAAIDLFIQQLRAVGKRRSGEAVLETPA